MPERKMAMRRWYDYNKDPLPAGTRPRYWDRERSEQPYNTVVGYEKLPSGITVPIFSSTKSTPVQREYVNPYEIVEDITQRFNAQPVTYTTDPLTGKVVASKSMAAPEMPSEVAGRTGLYQYFKRPGNENLTANFVLPEGALTGERFLTRRAPLSDASAQLAEQAGFKNIGDIQSTLNPQTYWPESAFQVPMRKYTSQNRSTPLFGTTTDYSSGRSYYPPSEGLESFETFNPRFKTPPNGPAWQTSGTPYQRRREKKPRQWQALSPNVYGWT